MLSLLNMNGPRTRRVSWSDEEKNVLLQCIFTMSTAGGLLRSWVERVEPT
ncbi:LRR receptor-like serine/threonine-protein kinase RPK2 [Corchorus olitorius]|uniref:LRR receptor-like serine/threonine-protein kinase RPK2 n=1 Tax=Corchorus olitorius TaxID=93759 RepID=A0A1R3HG30_9ROSI|nr:LRR receptor-like serine/threonine-protein kinase RPK2 [Corchorus olitorius]